MSIRHLINEDGAPFNHQELKELNGELDSLNVKERKELRNSNADAIAKNKAAQMLIVAGPGTGKSTLFKQRILYWLGQKPAAKILALSFVRKLVADLSSGIVNDDTLSQEQKQQTDVFTLHKYARRVVEQNRGTREWKFAHYFRIIVEPWKDVVWDDVLLLAGQEDHQRFSWKAFENQLHEDQFEPSEEWKTLKHSYYVLCQFYNATGFSDLILRARDALVEKPDLNTHQFFIIDEYQDFNAAEEKLLEQITVKTEGKLIVGDDDQVLYETLKCGKASLIRAIYKDKKVVNAMLPFCGRCGFHIVRAADFFMKQVTAPDCIKKIYLPMTEARECVKVQAVACATPATAVAYISRFLDDHNVEIEQRKKDLSEGKSTDAYLLILSPSREIKFYRPNGANEQLLKLVKRYGEGQIQYSDDYYKVLNYYSLANYPANNFTFRKVLQYERVDKNELLSILKMCIAGSKPISSESASVIKQALVRAETVRDIIESSDSVEKKVEDLGTAIGIAYPALLRTEFEKDGIDKSRIKSIEHQEEEEAEREEIEVKRMSAVELMPIVRSKGLSADHVIIIGFDNVNMRWITRNAFFVAMTRARETLHLITALGAGGAVGPSEYLGHLPDANVEFSKYKKTNGAFEVLAGRAEFLQYLGNIEMRKRRR